MILSAPSGCGKTTIVDRLLKRHPDWERSVSVTTRSSRGSEKEGQDYFFVTAKAFRDMEAKGDLLESAKVFDHYYGTPKSFVLQRIKEGKVLMLAIDVQGTRNILKSLGQKLSIASIFVLPPSLKVLRERLEGRKTDTPEDIDRRISMAQEEIKLARIYDCTVMNQTLEHTVIEVENFLEKFQRERRKSSHAIHTT